MNGAHTAPSQQALGEISDTLWSFARNWRAPKKSDLHGIENWDLLLSIAAANRMQALFGLLLEDPTSAAIFQNASPHNVSELKEQVQRLEENGELMSRALGEYLRHAQENKLQTVVLKGLWLSLKIYGDSRTRPGGDIDILLRKRDLSRSLDILEAMGLGRWWPNLLQDEYYTRHHLHLQMSTKDLKVWFEPHWAFDHPYTAFTIDYDALLDRSTPGQLLGEPVAELAPPDLLLSLSLHLVKHAVYLPAIIEDSNLGEVILADGMLMYFLDIHEVIQHYGEALDWTAVVQLAKQTGTEEVMGSVLKACRRMLLTPVPDDVISALEVRQGDRIKRFLLRKTADYQMRVFRGQSTNSFWDFMLMTNGAFVLRPIRVLDTLSYLFPSSGYLKRRYGSAALWCQVQHVIGGLSAFLRLGWDTLYYGWERHRRLKKLDLNPSIFNRLETE